MSVIPHVRVTPSGYYWAPSIRLKRLGFAPECLGKDLIQAVSRAKTLNVEAAAGSPKDSDPVGQMILRELRAHRGQMVTVEQLHEALYGIPEDGGPEPQSIQKMIHTLRKAGAPIVRVSGYTLF